MNSEMVRKQVAEGRIQKTGTIFKLDSKQYSSEKNEFWIFNNRTKVKIVFRLNVLNQHSSLTPYYVAVSIPTY